MVEMAGMTRAVEIVGRQLVSFRHWKDASFLSLPLVYPSGSPVTVKICFWGADKFHVSDGGFAYRELESCGVQRSFGRTADALLEAFGVARDMRRVFAVVHEEQLPQGIIDVATSSWQIVDRILSRIKDEDDDEIKDYVAERLMEIFGAAAVSADTTLVGASTSPWEMTALVTVAGKMTAFQAVSAHPNSVYRANAAFDDLAALDNAPGLVAVVESKPALGPKLMLLARQSSIIEAAQPDAAYRRAAA